MPFNLIPFLIFALLAVVFFRPKQPQNDIEVQEADIPLAEPGAPTGVIIGCPRIKSSHLVYQGDVKQIPIYTKTGKK